MNSIINQYKLLFSLLNYKNKKKFLLIIVICFFQSIFEMASVGLIIPIIVLIDNPSIYENYLSNYFINRDYFYLFFISLILIFFIFKTFFLYFCNRTFYLFAFTIEASFKKILYFNFLNENYSNHLENNSSKFLSDMSVNLRNLTFTYVAPLFILMSDGLLVIAILFFLCFYDFYSFALLSVIFLSGFYIANLFISKKNIQLGKEKESSEEKFSEILKNIIGNIKLVNIYNIKNFFSKEFAFHNKVTSIAYGKFYALLQAPRIGLELIAFVSIAFVILIYFLNNQNSRELITILGVFGASAFKFMPSINRIILANQSLKFSINTFRNFYLQIINLQKFDLPKNTKKEAKFEKFIEFRKVYFSYKNNDNYVLKNINFKFQIGETIGIIGKSASGKSTLVDIIASFLKPKAGEIIVDDKKFNYKPDEWGALIGYVPQKIFLMDNTILNNITFELRDENIDWVHLIKIVKICALATGSIDEIRDFLNLKAGESGSKLSGGQIQRIGLARALYKKPKILILDEFTSSLNKEMEIDLVDSINVISNLLKIIISHKDYPLKNCNQVFEIKNSLLNKIK